MQFATGHGVTSGGIDIRSLSWKKWMSKNVRTSAFLRGWAILYGGCQALLVINGTVISFTNTWLQESRQYSEYNVKVKYWVTISKRLSYSSRKDQSSCVSQPAIPLLKRVSFHMKKEIKSGLYRRMLQGNLPPYMYAWSVNTVYQLIL